MSEYVIRGGFEGKRRLDEQSSFEAEELLAELLTVSKDEETVIGWPRIFQVAARRPPA